MRCVFLGEVLDERAVEQRRAPTSVWGFRRMEGSFLLSGSPALESKIGEERIFDIREVLVEEEEGVLFVQAGKLIEEGRGT